MDTIQPETEKNQRQEHGQMEDKILSFNSFPVSGDYRTNEVNTRIGTYPCWELGKVISKVSRKENLDKIKLNPGREVSSKLSACLKTLVWCIYSKSVRRNSFDSRILTASGYFWMVEWWVISFSSEAGWWWNILYFYLWYLSRDTVPFLCFQKCELFF